MTLETVEFETGPQPTASILVLHGLGADGNDFVPITEMLDLGRVGPVRFIHPHAPTRPVSINNGYVMRAWYDIRQVDLVRQEDEAGLRESLTAIEALLARERERGVASERTVLMGFSQGCAMTLMTGLRHAHRLAALVGLSGYLPLAGTTAAERHAANHDTPIFLAHGSSDNVVPIERGAASRDALKAMGHPVEWHEYPMAHSVHPQEVADLNAFLLRVLG